MTRMIKSEQIQSLVVSEEQIMIDQLVTNIKVQLTILVKVAIGSEEFYIRTTANIIKRYQLYRFSLCSLKLTKLRVHRSRHKKYEIKKPIGHQD